MTGPHRISAGQAADWLAARHPDWTVRTVRVHAGLRVEACRDGSSAGLCALIGTFEEVRAELDADSRAARGYLGGNPRLSVCAETNGTTLGDGPKSERKKICPGTIASLMWQ